MRVRRALPIVFLLAIAATSATTPARTPQSSTPAKSSNNNAATWYKRAYERFKAVNLTEVDWEVIYEFEANPSRGPSDAARQVFARLAASVSLTLRASHQTYSDFAYPPDAAPQSERPHWRNNRELIKVLRNDLLIRLHDGDHGAVAERLAAMYRMAEHSGQNGVVTDSLIGGAMIAFADSSIQLVLDHGAIGPVEADRIVKAMRMHSEEDPLGYAAAAERERQGTSQWLLERYAGPGGAQKLAEEQHLLEGRVSIEAISSLIDAPQDQIDDALHGLDRAMESIVETFRITDPVKAQAEFERINAAIDAGEYGALAKAEPMLKLYDKAHKYKIKAQEELARRRLQLSDIAAGRVDPKTFTNAAVWYIRAATAIEKIEPALMHGIRQYAQEHATAPEASIAEALSGAQPIVDLLREGSHMKRCDFEYARGGWPQACAPYHAGLREAARLLQADACRLIHAGDFEAAADRIAICYRMCSHIAADRQLVSSLVAQVNFRGADAIAAVGADAHMFTDDQLLALREAIETLSIVDAFGYHAAVSEARSELQYWMAQAHLAASDAVAEQARTLLNQQNADALWWLLVCRDQAFGRAESAMREFFARFERLEDAFDIEALREALPQTAIVRRLVEQRQPERVGWLTLPNIAKFKQRMDEARKDLHAAHKRFREMDKVRPRVNSHLDWRP